MKHRLVSPCRLAFAFWAGVVSPCSLQADLIVTRSGLGSTNSAIFRYSEDAGMLLTNFTAQRPEEGMEGCVFGPDGLLYVAVSQASTGAVLRFSARTGQYLDTFVAPGSGGLSMPSALRFGPDGDLYVAGSITDTNELQVGRVMRFNGTNGAYVSTFVRDGSGGVRVPFDIAFGPDNNLYVADAARGILRYNGFSGNFLGVFVAASSGSLGLPGGMTFGPDRHLYVSSITRSAVIRYNGANGTFLGTFVGSGSGGLVEPRGLAFGPDGNLYICNAATDSPGVIRFSGQTGMFMDLFIPPESRDRRGGPNFLAFTPPRVSLGWNRLEQRLRISWPASATNFVLESTLEISETNTWMTVTNSPVMEGTNSVFVEDIGPGSRFFRLRKL